MIGDSSPFIVDTVYPEVEWISPQGGDEFDGGENGDFQTNGTLVTNGDPNCPEFLSTVTL